MSKPADAYLELEDVLHRLHELIGDTDGVVVVSVQISSDVWHDFHSRIAESPSMRKIHTEFVPLTATGMDADGRVISFSFVGVEFEAKLLGEEQQDTKEDTAKPAA